MLRERLGHLYVGGQSNTPFAQMKVTKEMIALENKIIECRFEKGKWVFMRQRTDKSFPNSYNTATGNSFVVYFLKALYHCHLFQSLV